MLTSGFLFCASSLKLSTSGKRRGIKGEIVLKVLILNGELSGGHSLDRVQDLLLEELRSRDWKGEVFLLNRLDIHYCTGCFGCWVQTPGVCIIPDASSLSDFSSAKC